MKGIKGKLLASFNGASKEELMIHLKNYSGPWTILHYLIEEGKQKENILKRSKTSAETLENITQLSVNISAISNTLNSTSKANQFIGDESQEFIENINAAHQHVLNILNR
ncbi:hypothetical protein F8M41_015092 [Gigaspora margarita]|uniref:Uncharacterized protein n=1 Tax=Gigaspora margarita TaxID=4874 RepID=A0A8H4AQY3_GIGMA|nr:hypothetical protein F8M41_015092 [Gigaspora margarita]